MIEYVSIFDEKSTFTQKIDIPHSFCYNINNTIIGDWINMITKQKSYIFHSLPADRKLCGSADEAVQFLTRDALCDVALWKKFVQVFRDQEDGYNLGWRGEYWGKMMRGAAMVYSYSHDENLYRILTDTVRDLLTVAEADGRVSSYSRDTEMHAWDMWCRKYVLLGLQYYYDICKDEDLKREIVPFLCGCADAILAVVGSEEGKLKMNETSESWGGLNSSSILEPIMRLYVMTEEERYLKFAEHIIENGGSTYANIFELAYQNELYPYQYGVSKAYEMISCFEGLVEYYLVTGIEKYKTAAVNFGKALIDSDVSVIGSLGATHELLDHCKVRQTAYEKDVRQETCVTITWMKYCALMLKLTGESLFADQIEQSFFNAYRGALNVEHRTYEKYLYNKCFIRLGMTDYYDTFLPFDSYSPLTPDRRGRAIGGCQILPDNSFYGCCACIGAAGVGAYLDSSLLTDGNSLIVNFFENGTSHCVIGGQVVKITVKTEYPNCRKVSFIVKKSTDAPIVCKVRIPAWSGEQTEIRYAGAYTIEDGYATLTIDGKVAEFTVALDMQVRMIKPIAWESDLVYTDRSLTTATGYRAGAKEIHHEPADDQFVCLMRGPITLAADSRMGKSADSKFTFQTKNGTPIYEVSNDREIAYEKESLVHCIFKDMDGNRFSLIDYGSAGRDWKTTIAAWLPI